MTEKTDFERNLERILIIQKFGDLGICGEFQGVVDECPIYAEDCPKTCTYSKNMETYKNER